MGPVPSDVATPAHLQAGQNPPLLRANIEGFERLLAHNRKTKIVWAHAGSDPLGHFTPALVRALLGGTPIWPSAFGPSAPGRAR